MSASVSPEPAETTDVPLLKIESGMTLYGDGITTIQFWKGDAESARTFLKERLALVIQANPWITGSLVRDSSTTKKHGKLVVLRYSEEKVPVEAIFDVNNDLQLREDMTYVALGKAVAKSKAHIPAGTTLLNKPLPVARLTVAPCAGGGSFATIFSMSHTVGNGGTYFTLLNMLSDGCKVFTLNAARKQELSDKGPALVGEREYASHLSAPAIMNGLSAFIGMKCCGKRPQLFCFNIDEQKLSAAVAEALKAPGAPGKISMNDILTSGYGQLVKPRLLTMALDYRGKIDGLTETDAGNYHNGLVYDPNGYASPAAIRESLSGPPPLSRATLPCCCNAICCKTATITNWASVMKDDFSIPNCTQTLSVPYVDSGMVPTDCAIIFKSGPGKVAMMLWAKRVSEEEIKANLPLGEAVSADMFPVL